MLANRSPKKTRALCCREITRGLAREDIRRENPGRDPDPPPHACHGCGYALANAGHDTRAIQDWLDHRSIQYTVRYTEAVADAVQRLLSQLGGNVRQRGVRLAWLNQRDIFVGVRSAERIKNTFSDDAPILNFCRTFGHHRSPSPANQYCRCRTLSPVAF